MISAYSLFNSGYYFPEYNCEFATVNTVRKSSSEVDKKSFEFKLKSAIDESSRKMAKLRIPTKVDYFGSNAMSKQDMYAKVIKVINTGAAVIGAGVLGENFTFFNLRFFFTLTNVLGFLTISVYDIYLFADDLFRVCFLLLTLSVLFQALSLLQTFLYKKEKIIEIVNRVRKFLDNCNTPKANEISEKWIMIACHCGLSFAAIYATAFALIMLYPLIYFLMYGEMILHFGYELPMVDWHTAFGYMLNFAYTLMICIIFVIGLATSTAINVVFIAMSFCQFELIQMHLEELDQLIVCNKDGESIARIRKYIGEVTDLHNELVE